MLKVLINNNNSNSINYGTTGGIGKYILHRDLIFMTTHKSTTHHMDAK